jgi:hypothetical protein
LNWISKEPGYGRHVKELYDMIPDCRVVILARDGRDTALSMAKNGWCNGEVRQCIDRWRLFTQMTLDALELVPSENYLLINYEDLILDFNQKIRQILDFYGINLPQSVIDEESVKNPPIKDNFNKWKKAMSEAEIAYFEETCQAVMRQLGYETLEPLVQKQAL